MGKKKDLKDALKGRNKISSNAIDKLKEQFGIKGGVRDVAKDLGVKIKKGGKKNASPFGFEFPGAEGFTPAEFDYQSALNLVNAQGNIDTQIANINADAARLVERIRSGGLKGVARIQANATRYVADRELEGALGVENIRAKGAIDLQKIVNAGLENVENIRGGYGIQGKKIDRSTAILGGLVNAFNFS